MTELSPVPDTPALRLAGPARAGEVALIVADVHLGLGASRERPAGPPEASASGMADALDRWARRAGAARIVIAGDAKHPIAGTPRALGPIVFEFFADLLARDYAVDLVPGNHDAGIVRHLPREVQVHPATGIVRESVGIFHGHRWPSAEVLRAEQLVAGHLHPGVRFAPTDAHPEGKRPCWVRVAYPARRPPPGRRKRDPPIRASEMIVLPPANPLAGIEALNRERPQRNRTFLVRRFLASGSARAYLLDGTDVGTLFTRPKDAPKRGSPRRGPPAR